MQHLEASSSSARQELSAARLAGIADRQRDGCQISSLKAQVEAHGTLSLRTMRAWCIVPLQCHQLMASICMCWHGAWCVAQTCEHGEV